jgi:hypothetical protein
MEYSTFPRPAAKSYAHEDSPSYVAKSPELSLQRSVCDLSGRVYLRVSDDFHHLRVLRDSGDLCICRDGYTGQLNCASGQ